MEFDMNFFFFFLGGGGGVLPQYITAV